MACPLCQLEIVSIKDAFYSEEHKRQVHVACYLKPYRAREEALRALTAPQCTDCVFEMIGAPHLICEACRACNAGSNFEPKVGDDGELIAKGGDEG